ncbi:MAG: TRAP transporter large permease subunit [Proteobacteria bacterium]|nr:TRAP transporter large permease subunit [Pseudomonadota bacterium]
MPLQNVEKIQISVERGFNIFSAAVITFSMLLTTVDVVLRYLFNSPLPGVYTIVEMSMLGAVFPAVAYVQQTRGNVRVDIFIDRITGNPRRVFELATLFLAFVAFALMCWQIGLLAREAWVTGDFDMGLIELPFWPPMTVMTIGLGLLCLRFVTDIKNYLIELKENSSRWSLLLILSLLPLAAFTLFLGLVRPGEFNPMTVGWIMMVAMVVVLLMGLPVSFGLLLVGIVGYWVLGGPTKTFSLLGIVPYERISHYPLSCVPLFILMGHLAYQAGFANSMYSTVQKWIGHMPGSMAQATVLGGAAFGAACGAGIASCATLGKICIPVMRNFGVDTRMALGCVAATGGLAALIPPSIVMVIIALITDQSVGKLLIAGIIPGLVAAGCFMVIIYIRVKLNPKLAPQALSGITWKERIVSLKGSWGIVMLAIIVMGGIYAGIFTPTEAGALGASGALFLGLITKRLTMQNFKDAIMDSTKTTAMILLILAAATVFGCFLGISRIPTHMSDFLLELQVPRLVVLTGVIVMYIIAGMFMDMIAFTFLTLPIVYPAIIALGYDPIWFGVVIVVLCELALITPPFGLNLFILRGMIPGVTMGDVIIGSVPFMFMYVLTVILMILFPGLATWLPSLM